LDERRRRLLFRSWHCGIREVDLVMGRFADSCIGDLNASELDDYERILAVPTPVLLSWVMGETQPLPEDDSALLRRLCAFHSQGPKA
jgi:antitoxin CptB